MNCSKTTGVEMACYRHPDEVPELTRRYLAHPAEREALDPGGTPPGAGLPHLGTAGCKN